MANGSWDDCRRRPPWALRRALRQTDRTRLANQTARNTLLRMPYGTLASPILDVGTGGGTLAVKLVWGGARVVAVDIAYAALYSLIPHIAVRPPGPRLALVSGDAAALPFAESTFGTVICNSVIEHTGCGAEIIGEIARVTKDGGALLISVPNREHRFGWRAASLWRLYWLMSANWRSFFARSNFIKLPSVADAAAAIDSAYEHQHLYTAAQLADALQPYFHIMDTRQYMCNIGAFAHDLALIETRFLRSAVIFLWPLIEALDNISSCVGISGKGIALIAIRKNRLG
jgi:SAM-dependent methyltransferase